MGKSNTRRYTAAVIGCGAIGMLGERDMKQIKPATHAGAYAVHKRITLVALVDVDSKNKKNAAQLFPGVQFFSNPEIMLKKMRPDIVSVATHTDTHVPLTELCMRSGVRAIMCEKPLAEKSKEGEVLLRLQKKYPKSLIFVNHMRRFDPLLKNAAQKVREGFIGEVLQATAYYTKGIRNNGTHAIDLLRYFCGDVAWVYAIPAVDTFHRPGDTNIDAILKFKSGTTVALQLLGNRDYDIFDLHLYGRKGALTITREGFELLWGRVMPSRDYQGFNELQRLPKVGEKRTFFAPMAEHIVRCLDGAERPVSTVADGVAALRVIEALLKSAQTSQKIIL